MNDSLVMTETQSIVVEAFFPHAPDVIWRALTTGELIGRWMMTPTGFAPVKGTRFTFQTRAAGAWDGVIHCEVLDAVPDERLVYAWRGGHASNVGYGSELDTVVTWNLTRADGGTHVRLVHSGFVVPKNASAFETMSAGWTKVVGNLAAIAAGH